jgi:hypothetical protein
LIHSPLLSRSSLGVSSLSHTISVCRFTSPPRTHTEDFDIIGLISQVAEELWEVKNKTIMNLTKQDITIVEYKRSLAKRSVSTLFLPFLPFPFPPSTCSLLKFSRRSSTDRKGKAHLKERYKRSRLDPHA